MVLHTLFQVSDLGCRVWDSNIGFGACLETPRVVKFRVWGLPGGASCRFAPRPAASPQASLPSPPQTAAASARPCTCQFPVHGLEFAPRGMKVLCEVQDPCSAAAQTGDEALIKLYRISSCVLSVCYLAGWHGNTRGNALFGVVDRCCTAALDTPQYAPGIALALCVCVCVCVLHFRGSRWGVL